MSIEFYDSKGIVHKQLESQYVKEEYYLQVLYCL